MAVSRSRTLFCAEPDLVLHGRRGKWVWNLCRINHISLELVLRGPKQKSPHNPNEISAFHPELVLRDISGKSGQRIRQT